MPDTMSNGCRVRRFQEIADRRSGLIANQLVIARYGSPLAFDVLLRCRLMTSTSRDLKTKVSGGVGAARKAFHDAVAKARAEIDTVTAEIKILRANLEADSADTRAKGQARIDEPAKEPDAARENNKPRDHANEHIQDRRYRNPLSSPRASGLWAQAR